MRPILIAAALAGAALSIGDSACAQEWGGAAGVAASRGYTASTGLATTSYGGAPAPSAPPVDAEALAAPPGVSAPAMPVAGFTAGVVGDIARRRGGAATARVRAVHGHRRRHPRAA